MTAHLDASPVEVNRKFYLPCLDGIRAIAFLMVFVAHAGLGRLLPGGLGVTIFFFLSGYLITTLLRLEAQDTGTISLRNFYIRRALRILPPMYITLGLAFVLGLCGAMKIVAQPRAYLAAISCVTDYYSMLPGAVRAEGSGMESLWSLCIEEHFYLLFPFLYLFFRRAHMSAKKQAGILLTACLVALVWRMIVVFVFHSHTTGSGPKWSYTTTDCRFDSIVWGCILAIHNNPWFGDRKSNLLASYKGFLALIGFAGILLSLLYRNPAYRETARYTLQGLCLYPIFYYCVATDRSWFVRILQYKPLRWLGTLSYSLYLCHLYILMEFWSRYWPHHLFVYGLLSFGLSLALAVMIRWTVELPLQRLRQSFRSDRRVASHRLDALRQP